MADDLRPPRPPAGTECRTWPALDVEALGADSSPAIEEQLSAVLDDLGVTAIQDLAEVQLPSGTPWEPGELPAPASRSSIWWRVFFDRSDARERARSAIAERLPHLRLTAVDVPDEDWAARSQRALTAVVAGRFIVTPPWDIPARPGAATVIVIEPSMGFGTGHHATTRLCLRALSRIEVAGRRVVDIGSGSGVLAIGAALAGAREILGLDIDEHAVQSADASATLNVLPVKPVFRVADFRSEPPDPADVVLANLTGALLVRAARQLRALVSPSGTLIVSGFDESEEADVRLALGDWRQERRLDEDGWVAFTLTMSEQRAEVSGSGADHRHV